VRKLALTFASLVLLAGCPRAPEPTVEPATPEPPVAEPVATAPEPAPSGWWCFTGRYPDATRSTSRCVRNEGECNGRLAERNDEGYTGETPECFRLARAQCTAFPTGKELCMVSTSHCEATRKIFSGRPGADASQIPSCTERS
jgi:hypothetical protein